MSLTWIRQHCLSLPHATEQMQWGDHLLFKVGGKMFAITTPDDPGVPVTLKCPAEEFDEWVECPGITPSRYLARAKWITLERHDLIPRSALTQLLTRSYELVVAGLPKKQQAQLQAGGAKPRKNGL